MDVQTEVLAELERVYSICAVPGSGRGGVPAFVAGSEGERELLLFRPPDFRATTLAREPGGFMSLYPLVVDGTSYVLASIGFYAGFRGEQSRLLLYPLEAGKLPEPVVVGPMPFTHRVAVCAVGGETCILASTLCAGKECREDWTQPGGIHMAVVPADVGAPWSFKQVVHGLNKNHGMDFARLPGASAGGYLLSALEGLFYMRVPAAPSDEWELETIAEGEYSDGYAFDWEGRGDPVVFSLSPLHGNRLSIHRRDGAGWAAEIIDDDIEFGHILWAGRVLGRPGLIAGGRRGQRELRLYRSAGSEARDFSWELIDTDVGAAQMAVIDHGPEAATLIVSAHGRAEVRLYRLSA